MSPALRSYFEPRFGADLSGVRLHTSEPAAKGINARAYALGQDIAFAPGAFAPETGAGRHLIAHEIAHTLQDTPQIHRQAEDEEEEAPVPSPPTTRSDRFDDTSGGGSTHFIEAVETAPTVAGDHIQGNVRRREVAPATDTQPQQDVADHSVFVDFNTAACEIRMPYRFGFRLDATDPRGQSCQGDPIDQADVDVDDIAQQYLDAVNGALNNEFAIHLSGCEHDCAGQDIPIVISATRDDINPDRTISVVPRRGRGDALTLCAGSWDAGFPVHEAGHQILGRGDEYEEEDPTLLAAMPQWGRQERVRNDFNILGSHRSFGRFGTFHERDFRHVQTFMAAALPDCTAELRSVGNAVLDYRIFAGGGFGLLGGTTAGFATAGFDVGIPLSRGRSWSVLVGAQADYLAQLGQEERRLVLAGMRLGFERRFVGETIGGRVQFGSRFGVAHELGRTEDGNFGSPPIDHPANTAAFGEAQIGAGVLLPTGNGGNLSFDLTGRAGGEISGRDDAPYWLNVGLMLGGLF